MHDLLKIDYPLPDDLNQWLWVTFDFDCVLETYTLTEEGHLIRHMTAWTLLPPGEVCPTSPFRKIAIQPLRDEYICLQGELTAVGHPPDDYEHTAMCTFVFDQGSLISIYPTLDEEDL